MYKNLTKILNKFGSDVTRLSKIEIGATRTVNGKRRRIDNSGKLRKSINYKTKVSKTGKSFEFSISMEEYGEFVDKGRKKGKGIPVNELLKWIKNKPIRLRDAKTKSFVKQTESKIKSLSFLINRKIKEKGIAATNFISDPFKKEFKNLPNEVIEAFGLDVDEFLEFALKDNKK